MLELMKIVGVSAVLSAGFVTASDMQGNPVQEPVSGKIYTDRIPEGDAVPARTVSIVYASASQDEGPRTSREGKGDLRQALSRMCDAQAWPNIAPECLGAADGTPPRGSVRMITVEQRSGANTSVLVRIPAAEFAQR